jgi:uncharacterized protein (DUF1919 family)
MIKAQSYTTGAFGKLRCLIQEKYVMKKAAGLWQDRKDLGSTEQYVRKMRKDTSSERFVNFFDRMHGIKSD